MRKMRRARAAFLVVGISLIFAIASAYANYNAVVEADFLALGARFEAGDIAEFLIDKQINANFSPSESPVTGLPEIDLHGSLIPSFFQISLISPSVSVLRC
jgi:hypothetical protein